MMIYNLIEILCGIVFIISGIMKFLDFGNTTQLLESVFGLNFSTMQYLLAILSSIEIMVGITLILGFWKINLVFIAIISLLSFFILVNLYFYFKGVANCGCFGTSISVDPETSLIKNIAVLLLLVFIKYKTLIKQRLKN